jgi:hypothetical protein
MLTTKTNFQNPDDVYARLIAAHDGLTEAESHAMNARLILILANHLGDPAILAEALRLARNPSAAPV